MSRCLLVLAALLACACEFEDVTAAAQMLEPVKELEASNEDAATPRSLVRRPRRFRAQTDRTRHRQQGIGLNLPTLFLIPGGEGEGPWGEWGEVSPCSRTCGGGVASQKRICSHNGPERESVCTGGDTKYFSCQTQDCPEGSGDFRTEQCAQFNDKAFTGYKYNWVPYTKAPNPCELNCMPHGERFYFRHKLQVTDGTRCNEDSFDVCVNGNCQPVGCDMMLNSTAREDKCRECRGNGTNCRTTEGIIDSQDLMKGYNDILLIPAGATSIVIEEISPSMNYLALRDKNGTYYLNGHYHIDFPRRITIAGVLWTYERSQSGYAAPDKLRCLGPTTEPLFLSLLLQAEKVDIRYEYSVPKNFAPATSRGYNWVHEEFTSCSATCGGGFQTRNVTCRSREELEIVDDNLCDEGLRPPTNQSCSPDPCPAQWEEGPWGECSQRCGSGGVRSREVTCQKIIANGVKSIVPENECFDQLGPKPDVFQKCNEDAPCPTWFVGNWRPCDELCDVGKRTRQVLCYQRKDGRIEVLDEKDCTEEKPEVELPCMLQPCEVADWVVSGWSGCDSCTSKYRTRGVVCSTIGRKVVNDSFCSYHKRPVDVEECNKDTLPACEVQWFATQWSKCSVTCGDGVQTRKVFCGMYYDNARGGGVELVDDANCDNLIKYKDTKPCTVPKEQCPSQWFAGPWTACTDECGGGEQYRRVMCFQGDKEVTYCDSTTVLDSTQLCNTGSCTQDDLLAVSSTSTDVIDEEEECEDEDNETDLDPSTPEKKMSNSPAMKTNSTEFVPAKKVCKSRKKLNCSETMFGCCPDKKTVALGPFDAGCLERLRTCQNSTYGCCPDGVAPAQGENNEGCPVEPCADTLFGCCAFDNKTAAQGNYQEGCPPPPPPPCALSELTAAFGPNEQGTHQFGCCPDGVTIAKGPDQQGCHCRESKFGCCGDGETPATGPDAAGCDCSSSRHGCCPDGRADAAGPKFLGCTDAPENKQAACSMPTDPGPCRNFTAMWFYDIAYGGCSRFWYGGCDGNGNRFATKEDCQDVCVQPSPKDACKLPSVKGACDGDYQRWHYNSTREQCIPFKYGGCLGNNNNFESRELCQKQCEPSSVTGQCDLPIDQGSCAGNFSRWGFNSEAHRCEQFIWGGCEGNSNRFSSEAACQMRCAGTQPRSVKS